MNTINDALLRVREDIIDYLLEDYSGDVCGKCMFYEKPKPGEDTKKCHVFNKCGNEACRTGMILYFGQKNKPGSDENVV